jgi:hypothetical protein
VSKKLPDTYTITPKPTICDRCQFPRPQVVSFRIGTNRRARLCNLCVRELAVFLQGNLEGQRE